MSTWMEAFESSSGSFTSLDGSRQFYRAAMAARSQLNDASDLDGRAIVANALGPVPVVFTASALESFLYDLTELRVYGTTVAKHAPEELETLRNMLERVSGSSNVALKFELARTSFSSKPFDRGSKSYQNFDTLLRLRNYIVHSRPLKGSHGTFAKLLDRLAQRGLIKEAPESGPGIGIIVPQRVAYTKNVANWACATVREFAPTIFDDPRSEAMKDFDGPRIVSMWFPEELPS